MKSRHCSTFNHHFQTFPILLLLILLLLLVFSTNYVDAQQPSDSSSSTVDDDYEMEGKRVSPSMAIIVIVLVLGFFITGCISIYVQQCSDNSSIGDPLTVGQPMRGVQRGIDQSVIDTYPTFLYSDVKELKIGKGALECAICINEFEEDETLRLLPVCDHVFHPECIDAWLSAHATCPVCRANLEVGTGELGKAEVSEYDHSGLSQSDHILVEVRVAPEPPKGRVPRSHSTGHSLVRATARPSEDRERFTLRLPDEIRKQLMVAQPRLKRTTSMVALPRVSSSRRGYRGGGGEGSGSSRYGRFFGRWTNKSNRGDNDGDGSASSKRSKGAVVTPMEALARLPV